MAYSKVPVNLQIDEKYPIYKQYHNLSGYDTAKRVQNIS
jgi:hypothetical protein